jgi:prepilin-type N-terminal cleavage/methylation domain-containing protein/prepilin-type processing-associated H-X9-DG protein
MKNHIHQVGIAPANRTRQRGFTLVELLVVITITVVLAALIVVMTGKIKQKAYQAKSLTVLNQMSTACTAYSLENNGDIMTVNFEGYPRMKGKWVTGSFWGAIAPNLFAGLNLRDDVTSAKLLNQAVTSLFGTQDRTMKGTFQGETYGAISDTCCFVPFAFNGNLTGWDKYRKVTQYEDPSATLYMAYGWVSFAKKDGEKYAPLPKTRSERSSNIDWFHNKTAAFLFLDGHVEILSPPIADRYYSDKPSN